MSDCGARCYREFLRREGKRVTLERARQACKTTGAGTYARDLVGAIQHSRYAARLVKDATWNDLRRWTKRGKTVFVSWQESFSSPTEGHWSIVESVKRDAISIWDPNLNGARTLPRAFFEVWWWDWEQSETELIYHLAVVATRRARDNS